MSDLETKNYETELNTLKDFLKLQGKPEEKFLNIGNQDFFSLDEVAKAICFDLCYENGLTKEVALDLIELEYGRPFRKEVAEFELTDIEIRDFSDEDKIRYIENIAIKSGATKKMKNFYPSKTFDINEEKELFSYSYISTSKTEIKEYKTIVNDMLPFYVSNLANEVYDLGRGRQVSYEIYKNMEEAEFESQRKNKQLKDYIKYEKLRNLSRSQPTPSMFR